jgi:hypothetical protein
MNKFDMGTVFTRSLPLSLSFALSLTLLLGSCSSGEESIEESKNNGALVIKNYDRAIQLLNEKCFACHSNKIPHDNLLAPPMIAVKTRYLKEYPTKEEFVNEFVSFVNQPKKEDALMKRAVEKHGLMPAQGTKIEDLEEIALYLYEADIEKPEWWENRHATQNNDPKTPKEMGLNYALSTKKALGKQLMKSIAKGGPAYAVEFCNVKALPITDSMSNHFNTSIKRVSDRPRNLNNLANDAELEVIEKYKSLLASKEEMAAIIKEESGGTRFYFPIETNGMCLKCHGNPQEDINSKTLAKIDALYPEDKARGYGENQIRGIWSILFNNQ